MRKVIYCRNVYAKDLPSAPPPGTTWESRRRCAHTGCTSGRSRWSGRGLGSGRRPSGSRTPRGHTCWSNHESTARVFENGLMFGSKMTSEVNLNGKKMYEQLNLWSEQKSECRLTWHENRTLAMSLKTDQPVGVFWMGPKYQTFGRVRNNSSKCWFHTCSKPLWTRRKEKGIIRNEVSSGARQEEVDILCWHLKSSQRHTCHDEKKWQLFKARLKLIKPRTFTNIQFSTLYKRRVQVIIRLRTTISEGKNKHI